MLLSIERGQSGTVRIGRNKKVYFAEKRKIFLTNDCIRAHLSHFLGCSDILSTYHSFFLDIWKLLRVLLSYIFHCISLKYCINKFLLYSQEWVDDNLRWNESEYGNIADIRVPPSLIWAPDILMYNSASETFDGTYPTNVVVTSGGVCTYIPPGQENYFVMMLNHLCSRNLQVYMSN